jgi:tetratricopeptide (TPR) repeat protein
MPGDDQIFEEAVSSVRQGDRHRGRDLLTRLLKRHPESPECWLWMSAVVDSPRERSYCLKQVLKFDPGNRSARRGLILLGALPPDPSLAIPPEAQTRNWMSQIQLDPALTPPPVKANPSQIAIFVGAVVILILLAFLGIYGSRRVQQARHTRAYIMPTQGPSPTYLPSPSPVVRTGTAVFSGPQPLWMSLEATYTPTAIYVNTPHPRSEDYRIAMRNYQKGDWQTMLDSLKFVAKAEPDAPDIQYYLGEAYRNLGQLDQADLAYQHALALNPQFGPAYVGLARVQLNLNQPDPKKALDDLNRAIQADPNLADAYFERIQIELDHKQADAALADLTVVETLQPDSFLLHFDRAQAHLLAGNNTAALDDARRASQIDITSLPAHLLVGEAAQAAGDPAAGYDALQVYTLYQTDDSQAWVWLGSACSAKGDMQKAVQAYTQAIQADSASPDAYLQRGLIYLDQKQTAEAIQDLTKAVQLKNLDFATHISLGKAYLLDQQYRPAYVQFNLAESYGNGTPAEKAEIYYLRGQALEALQETTAAIKEYKSLQALTGESISPEWLDFAAQRLQALFTPTATAKASLPTATPRAVKATATPKSTPTATPTP